MSSAGARKKYSQSVSLRKIAHQVLTSEECQTFKEALKIFRETKTPQQLVDHLELLLDSPKKLNLLREIVLLLPAPQRPEFALLCRRRFKGAELLLQETSIATEFENRFGEKMATMDGSSSGIGGGGSGAPGGGRRASTLAGFGGGRFFGQDADSSVTGDSLTARQRLTSSATAAAAARDKITLSDSAPIRRLSDERTASVIKLKSATFQVRYRSKLPLFDSLPESQEESEAVQSPTASTAADADSRAADDSADTGEDEDRRGPHAVRTRQPLSHLQDRGFWALHSPRRTLEETHKKQQQQQQKKLQRKAHNNDSDSSLTPEMHRRQHHRKVVAPADTAVKASIESGYTRKGAQEKTANSGEINADTIGTPVAELKSRVGHSPPDSPIYKLLYAPSSKTEDQASLTSSTLEGEFLKARHLQSQMSELGRDFDAQVHLEDGGRQRLPVERPRTDQGIQCDMVAPQSTGSFDPTLLSQPAQQQQQQQATSQFGFYFVPISAPYPGSHHLFHHPASASVAASPVTPGSYYPWSQVWTSMQSPAWQHQLHRQQPRLHRPAALHRETQKQQPQHSERLRNVTLDKAGHDSFGLSVALGPSSGLESQFVIASVATGSPAHSQGIQPGDRLLELEDEPVSNLSLSQLGLAVRSRSNVRLCLLSASRAQSRPEGSFDSVHDG